MAIVRWILVAAMAVIAALSVAHSFGLFSSEPASAASGRYYCPMHPQVVRDHPGECPICSMTLVEREGSNAQATSHERHRHEPSDPPVTTPAMPDMPADHDAPAPRGVPGLAPVELSFERVQKIGVRTASATLEALLPELSAVGIVSADEARLARVHTRFSGWIEQLAVPVTGQKVKRGQVLAGLYSPELLPAQQEFLAARRWSTSPTAARGASPATGSSLEQDARARLELFGLSPAEIDRIALTGKPTRTVSVTAPISGHVVSTNAVLGAYVRPGTQLFEIADLTQLWVLADVYEHEAPRVSVGQVADVRFAAYPSKLFSGKVGFIYPTIDAATRADLARQRRARAAPRHVRRRRDPPRRRPRRRHPDRRTRGHR
jgi:Cu(I)/Ag(I) efflux system membrane fusion protein